MPNNVHFVLSGLCAGILLIIAAELLTEQNNSLPRVAAARVSPPIRMARSVPDTEAIVAAILERPLFIPGRLPPSEEFVALPSETPKEALRQLRGRLAGVTIGPGVREALFIREGQKPIAVSIGSEIEGWKIFAIEWDGVTLSSPSGSQTIKPTNAPASVHPVAHPVVTGIGMAPSAVSSAPNVGSQANSADRTAKADSPAMPNTILDPFQLAARTGGRGPK